MNDFECNEFIVGELYLGDKEQGSISLVDDLRNQIQGWNVQLS
jgi:hypothetical protein